MANLWSEKKNDVYVSQYWRISKSKFCHKTIWSIDQIPLKIQQQRTNDNRYSRGTKWETWPWTKFCNSNHEIFKKYLLTSENIHKKTSKLIHSCGLHCLHYILKKKIFLRTKMLTIVRRGKSYVTKLS